MKNLSQASIAARQKAKLNIIQNLGVDKSQFTVENALSVLETAAGEFIEKIKDNIEKSGVINTAKITDIRAEVNETDQSIAITAPTYFFYQSEGVNGTQNSQNSRFSFSGRSKAVNIDAVKLWMTQKGIRANDISENSLAFLIARSIYRDGIEPKDFYQSELKGLADRAATSVADYTIKVIF